VGLCWRRYRDFPALENCSLFAVPNLHDVKVESRNRAEIEKPAHWAAQKLQRNPADRADAERPKRVSKSCPLKRYFVRLLL
jgi:hypothetical protein